MTRGMVCLNSNALTAVCVIVWFAGFPIGPTALTAGAATDSLAVANQSTPERKIRVYGFPGLSAYVATPRAMANPEPVPIGLSVPLPR